MNVMTTAAPFCNFRSGDARILAVSEDKLQGFQQNPLRVNCGQNRFANWCVVVERVQAMLRGGNDSASAANFDGNESRAGVASAWQVSAEKIETAFDFMFQDDPFSGIVCAAFGGSGVARSEL